MEAHQLPRLRRSIGGLQRSSAGPLTKEAALRLVEELISSRRETARYKATARSFGVLEALDRRTAG